MKTVAITGATSGIGLEAARALAGEGYRVLCVGRCEENCEKARLSIAASAPQASVRFFAAGSYAAARDAPPGAGDRANAWTGKAAAAWMRSFATQAARAAGI